MPDGPDEVIALEWIGIALAYQHKRTNDNKSIARSILETVEARARENERSAPEMPLYLEVDARNHHATQVYAHLGFELIDSVDVLTRGRYRRMVRSAVGPR